MQTYIQTYILPNRQWSWW